jgi:hypothetical protein
MRHDRYNLKIMLCETETNHETVKMKFQKENRFELQQNANRKLIAVIELYGKIWKLRQDLWYREAESVDL